MTIHTGKKSTKCTHCNFAFFHASSVWTYLKNRVGTSETYANSANLPYLEHLRIYLKTHSEKSNKCNHVCLPLIGQAIEDTFENTVEKCLIKCNQCAFESSTASNLRAHLKILSGEKSNKCKQCDFASSRASN